uniref:RNA-dependent RNA polymerase n=1 Tax=Sclerotinia sclerotiorum mitovirus 15 TaxID=1435443 RepID=W0G2H3_9VIRU|nr:RNA-dependent RNA polymerase [Sclerotinia sclerotiorum mitovirus 15]
MTKHFNTIYKHLTLLRDIGDIKLSLLWFSQWSMLPSTEFAVIASAVIGRFEKIAITRGRMAAIDEMKASRLAFTRWLCGRPLSGHVGAPISRNGLPKVLPLEVRKQLIRNKNDALVKDILTVLSISRFFKGGKPLDTEAITQTSNPTLPKDGEIILALKKLGLSVSQEVPTEWRFRWITTAGPNGPSISSSIQDLPKFNELFRDQVGVILPDLLGTIDKILSWEKTFKLSSLMKLDNFKSDSLRKISIKEDREGKCRPFAIFDYWSQLTLTPLHDWIYNQLRNIPNDCTFDQHKGVDKMNQIRSRKWFYSYDLKSATDRFPVLLQERVLSLLFNADYAKAWRELLTREPFRLGKNGELIKWGAGQPLGAKSSWAVFTLCHHLVVHIAAMRTNSPLDYVLLGDDIVIRGRALATEYKRIMFQLGVTISDAKTHVSKDTFEFAKIWSHQGRNVSGFPIVGLAETIRKPLEMAALFVFEAPLKGYLYSIDPRSVSHFFSPIAACSKLPPRRAIWFADKVAWYYSFLSALSTRQSDWTKYLVQMAGLVVTRDAAKELFSQTLTEKWAKQLDKTLFDFQEFGISLFERVKGLPPFKPAWDPKAWPGRMSASGIEFTNAAKHIPIFGAIETDGRIVYSDYLQRKLENFEIELTLEEIESLKLAPRPQLRGFEPLRAKESIRTLDLVSRDLNRALTIKGLEINVSAYNLK